MPITIAGSGTITGISAGGLPDGVITTDDIAADAVTSAKIASGAIVNADVNASAAIADSKLTGTTCKAWVNFSSTPTIRASGNVSSVTKDGTGLFTVNFTTAMTDANYGVNCSSCKYDSNDDVNITSGIRTPSVTPLQTGSVKVASGDSLSGNGRDVSFVCVSIFR